MNPSPPPFDETTTMVEEEVSKNKKKNIENAIAFLEHPSVKALGPSSTKEKRDFLRGKGVTDDEISTAFARAGVVREDDDKEEEEEELVDAFDELVAVVVPRRPHRRNAPCWWLPWFAHLVVAVVVDVDVDGVVDAIIFRFVFSLSFLTTTTLGGGGGGAKDFCIPNKEKGENLFFV